MTPAVRPYFYYDLDGSTLGCEWEDHDTYLYVSPRVTPVVSGESVDQALVWETSNPEVAYFKEDDNMICIVGPGKATITATSTQGLVATVKFEVEEVE